VIFQLTLNSPRKVLQEAFQKKAPFAQEVTTPCMFLAPKTFQWDKMWSGRQ
jgi:hypothetical protein